MPVPDESAMIMAFSIFSASIMTLSVCGSYAKALRRGRESIMASRAYSGVSFRFGDDDRRRFSFGDYNRADLQFRRL